MNIGFVNVFAFRPHVEHLIYLSELLKAKGHNVYFLTCDSSVSNCYAREIKGSGRISECSKCILGGVRSYTNENITSVVDQKTDLTERQLDRMALSSSCTLSRTESDVEWNDREVVEIRRSLYSPIGSVYESTKQWIADNSLEGVICFNGRMDLTRGVTYACESVGIPFISHERTWFGDGIQLVPNGNCLGLKALGELVSEYSEKPLTVSQAKYAGKLVGDRFLQRNSLEWRLYNQNPEPAPWPTRTSGKRILIVPSSKNEFAGHEDWETGWQDNTQALDDFFEVYNIHPEQVVLRCHPNWSENIGRVTGERSLRLYRQWAEDRGIHFISSEEKASTYDLIQQSDIVVLNGGSSAVEAGACGKQVVCLGPAPYERAGFAQIFLSRQDMEENDLLDLDEDLVRRKTLRFLYVRSHRYPQFVDYVKALETTKYQYFEGADPDRIIRQFETGNIEADDPVFSEFENSENEVLSLLRQNAWGELADYEVPKTVGQPYQVSRRFAFRWVDGFRSMFSRGDRG